MPGKISKYNAKTNCELKMRVIAILDEAEDTVMPTLDWIKQQDMILAPYSTQKLSRILGDLADMGLVKKGKSKTLGRMVYRLTSKMKEAGYEIEDKTDFRTSTRAWNGISWELEDQLKDFD